MAPPALTLQSTHHPKFTCNLTHFRSNCTPQSFLSQSSTRRVAVTVTFTAFFLAKEAFSSSNIASSFDFRMTVPDQTLEEAEMGIRGHAQELLQIKALIDSELWIDTQKALRESSPSLKQDLYTIIQAKPGSQRPLLRKLYSKLFNSVTRLDYAARSKDAAAVQECYDNIRSTLDDIFTMI